MVTGHNPEVPRFKYGECVITMTYVNKSKRIEYCVYIRHDHRKDYIVYNPSTGQLLSRHAAKSSQVYPSDWKFPARPSMIPVTSGTNVTSQPQPQPIENNNVINPTTAPEDVVSDLERQL